MTKCVARCVYLDGVERELFERRELEVPREEGDGPVEGDVFVSERGGVVRGQGEGHSRGQQQRRRVYRAIVVNVIDIMLSQ